MTPTTASPTLFGSAPTTYAKHVANVLQAHGAISVYDAVYAPGDSPVGAMTDVAGTIKSLRNNGWVILTQYGRRMATRTIEKTSLATYVLVRAGTDPDDDRFDHGALVADRPFEQSDRELPIELGVTHTGTYSRLVKVGPDVNDVVLVVRGAETTTISGVGNRPCYSLFPRPDSTGQQTFVCGATAGLLVNEARVGRQKAWR